MVNIPDVVDQFRNYKLRDCEWGSLHIVLSDGNIKNDDVEFCIKLAKMKGDEEGEKLAKILLSMSKTQRKKLPYRLSV